MQVSALRVAQWSSPGFLLASLGVGALGLLPHILRASQLHV